MDILVHVTGNRSAVHSQSMSVCCVFWRKDKSEQNKEVDNSPSKNEVFVIYHSLS